MTKTIAAIEIGIVKYKYGQWVLINNIWMEFIKYLSPTEELWRYEAGGKECNFHRHLTT